MEQGNQTFVSEFILQGLFIQEGHEGIIFSVLLFMYLLILLGNLLIVLLIRCDAHLLRTPMYFFLSHLSLTDVGFASSIVPVMLRNLVSQDKVISYGGCLSQMHFVVVFGNTGNFLLAVMAYDRYLAICLPLHYTGLMNRKRCLWMVSGCWLLAVFEATLYVSMISHLSFCASQKIPHFFCDLFPLLGLSCSDTTAIQMLLLTEGMFDILGLFILIVFSYARIFLTVMKIPSSSSKRKAFSTCGSHLAVVILFYGTLCWVYLLPSFGNKTLASLMYTVVSPMLNPFIYSLRNNEMKSALKRLLIRMRVICRLCWTMEQGNQTFVSEFILQGLFIQEGHEGIIFSILLFMYLLSLLGNLLIVLLIRCDAHLLRTPMYFFLSHLSLTDVGFASSIVPVMLRNLVSQDKVISYGGCLSQMHFVVVFGNTGNFLLAVMAYDRYLAICLPLHYTGLMNRKRCLWMVSGCWLLAVFEATLYVSMISHLSFCASQKIPHFFCDLFPLLGLSCSDTTAMQMLLLTEGMFDILGPFILIVFSYARIFLTVMKIPSLSSKRKAFSTCGSHLAVVILFYGTLCWVYLLPSFGNKTLASLMYTVVSPMLNPFIYSLRNNEMKSALKRLLIRMRVICSSWK
ncbi:uncharacterized protein LOC129346508 [Eublepharis macularius]|uniref:Uncharacterized protein LOC129346508 n=1 Tax=Eublepharis macularius TaxID=481883 RepID=A0AA97KNN4_EUBMA|nr:uncharacterized protein LOC129346508 [Eublepharis macularius]